MNILETQGMYNRGTRPVANQHILVTPEGRYFKSYDSICAFVSNDGTQYVSDHWDYSRTTLKYLRKFFNDHYSTSDIQNLIKKGEIKTNLSINGELL